MQTIEPIIATEYNRELLGKMKPTEVIRFMIIAGYSDIELKSQKKFEAAYKDLLNQIKYN